MVPLCIEEDLFAGRWSPVRNVTAPKPSIPVFYVTVGGIELGQAGVHMLKLSPGSRQSAHLFFLLLLPSINRDLRGCLDWAFILLWQSQDDVFASNPPLCTQFELLLEEGV